LGIYKKRIIKAKKVIDKNCKRNKKYLAWLTRTAKMDPFLEQNGQTDWNVLSFLKDGEERIGLFVQTRLNSL
jgi:hypothetical protein